MSEITITFTGPWLNSTAALVVKGVAYLSALGNSLDISCSTWTNLASGTIGLYNSRNELVVTGSVVSSGDDEQIVRVELPEATLDGLGVGNHQVRLNATLAGRDYLLHSFWLWVKG